MYNKTVRILVIDDEQAVREMLKETLREQGFAVDTASDGERGVYLACSNTYDLIVLDNRLPKKNGLEVIEEVRSAGKTTPILVLSVLSDARRKAELLNSGADDYLIKPFSFEELLARIRALLRRPTAVQEDVISVHDLVLDTRRHEVRRNNEEVHLTRKEFSLLEYLMRHIGIVLTRGMLMEHVWDMEIDPFSNTIEAHIASLRRKLDTEGNLIVTVSGRGYKIRA